MPHSLSISLPSLFISLSLSPSPGEPFRSWICLKPDVKQCKGNRECCTRFLQHPLPTALLYILLLIPMPSSARWADCMHNNEIWWQWSKTRQIMSRGSCGKLHNSPGCRWQWRHCSKSPSAHSTPFQLELHMASKRLESIWLAPTPPATFKLKYYFLYRSLLWGSRVLWTAFLSWSSDSLDYLRCKYQFCYNQNCHL